ncbi:hypothetical protein D9M73_247530 [compost metagenome]
MIRRLLTIGGWCSLTASSRIWVRRLVGQRVTADWNEFCTDWYRLPTPVPCSAEMKWMSAKSTKNSRRSSSVFT